MRVGAWLRRRAGEALYALTDAPVAAAGLAFVAVVLVSGAALLVVFVGLPVLAGGLAGARALGRVERRRARWLGIRVTEPVDPPDGRLRDTLVDPTSWRAVLYVVAKPPLAAVTTLLAVAGYGAAGLGLSYPFWFARTPMVFGSYRMDTAPRVAAVAVLGALALAVTPLLLAGPLTLSRLAVRGLLGPSRLGGRVRALEQARGHAIEVSAAALRRIERDLHDGTQARLVTLAMDLGHARELAVSVGGPSAGALRATIDAAHRNAQQAVAELRDLVRGIHPPVLDGGLGPALESLTLGLAVPVDLRVELARRPHRAVETIVYFCAAELLANVVKHSDAGTAAVELVGDRRTVTLRVTDDGAGGAAIPSKVDVGGGSGLAGLAVRVAAVDGALHVDSPPGGPTAVTVRLPLVV
jgi:signal transduction histidine kinase